MTDKEKYEAVKAELERRMYDDYNDGEEEEDAVAQGVCASMIMFMDSLPDEPSGEDLKEEIDRWYNNEASKDFENVLWEDICECARHFANWQKQQMIKDVVEATIIKTRVTNHTMAPTLSTVILSDAFHEGDKVKVKIVKED